MKAWLKFAGKGERKVAAVFGLSPGPCDKAVRYLRRQLPDIPVWLFTTQAPAEETAAMCERVVIESDSMALLIAAEKELWPRWVAISVATWVGERGGWPVKLAPLLIPPFRALLMNERADFFPARPGPLAIHARRRGRDAVQWIWHRVRDINRGLWLLIFAWIAQWSSPLSRYVFRRNLLLAASKSAGMPTLQAESLLHKQQRQQQQKQQQLQKQLKEQKQQEGKQEQREQREQQGQQAEGATTLVLRYSGRRWDHRAFEKQIRSSTARYVLLQQDPAADDLHDLLPLFQDPRTFAVSRQPAYRLWHPMLFPTAPFRQLQSDVASRTLAPVSHSILFHREKLLQLGGIPETIVPGSALYLIFWQAAAAGWLSFSGGGTCDLEECADRPYEESEFVVRVLSRPALKQLSPRDPDLCRGNIGFQIHEPATYTPGRLRVLVVSPYLPYPLSHGGAVRIYNLCRALSERVDLVLATFREKDDHIHFDKLHEVFREVYVVDIDEKKSKDATLPDQVRGHVSAAMRALIAQLCRDRNIDLLQIEFTHLAQFRDAAPATPAILVEHDLTFSLYRQLAERDDSDRARAEYERWLAFERHWLQRYDAVWTMSDEDNARAIDEGSPAGSTFVVANGVDVERFVPCDQPTQPPEIFYVGSFRHLPNILGFERLRHEIMPRVWSRFPDARLRVVAGPDPERYWREFLGRDYPGFDERGFDGQIMVHAFVEDLRPLYAKATLVVIPLEVSAGTNIKVLEAMACQKAVVSTPVGCTGLGLVDGQDALIRPFISNDSPDFADAICDLLADPARRGAIAAAGRRTVEQRFSWRAIAGEAYASYVKTAGVTAP